MKRNPARPSRRGPDEQHSLLEIDVAYPKTKSFAEPDAGAIEDEEQRPVDPAAQGRRTERSRRARSRLRAWACKGSAETAGFLGDP
jgi:hypothetical protein